MPWEQFRLPAGQSVALEFSAPLDASVKRVGVLADDSTATDRFRRTANRLMGGLGIPFLLYGHGFFLLAHGSRGLIQSEPLEAVAPQPDPALLPVFSERPGSRVSFEAITRGSEPMGYQWRRDGVDLPGETTQYLTVTHADGAGPVYTCWVTNAWGGATVGPYRIVTAEAAQLDLPPHGLGVRVRGTPGARY